MAEAKISLSLLKKLLTNLEESLESSEKLRKILTEKNSEDNMHNYLVEMAKTYGFCAGMMQETSMLMNDIAKLAVSIQVQQPKPEDLLTKLLGGLKGSAAN